MSRMAAVSLGARAVAQAQPRTACAASALATPGSLRLARSQTTLRSSSSALFRSTPSLSAAVPSPATQPSPARQPLQVASKAGYKLKTHKVRAPCTPCIRPAAVLLSPHLTRPTLASLAPTSPTAHVVPCFAQGASSASSSVS